MYKIGFDNEKYLKLQSAKILERINNFGNKLYLEFGGKMFDDFHASRVLPGFAPDSKIRMLETLSDKAEIVLVIRADDIDQNRTQGDQGISYCDDTLRLIDLLKLRGLYVSGIVITKYAGQGSANLFKKRLEGMGFSVYIHYMINDYPTNISFIMSDEGFGKNDYIQTTRPLVVVAASGSSSGKMATCLSQLYHESKRGIEAGYAKFEKFPIWNLPISHPVNLAYEAATVDINDVNMIDPFHLEAYGKSTVNYNRDVEVFPILDAVFKNIWSKSPYKSPTDMGVNMFGECIVDDEVCQSASKQEIIRRYYITLCKDLMFGERKSEIQKLEILMKKAKISTSDRRVVSYAKEKANDSGVPSVAIELPDGEVITGRTTSLLGASSSALLNALKTLAGINDEVRLISQNMIEPIQKLNLDFLGNLNPHLNLDEVLVALSISTTTNTIAEIILEQLPKLKNSEVHSTVILSEVDINIFHKLGMNVTCEPVYKK